METKRTNKKVLYNGVKKMALAASLMFIGPTLFYIATTNKDKTLYIPLLILSIIICISAVVIAFKGLQTIMKSMFESNLKK